MTRSKNGEEEASGCGDESGLDLQLCLSLTTGLCNRIEIASLAMISITQLSANIQGSTEDLPTFASFPCPDAHTL
jgi:hypothetical protein